MGGTSTPRATALGAELKRARQDSGLTLRDLADRLDLSHPTLSRYENGGRMPEPFVVAKICEALGVPDEQRDELVEQARAGDTGPWLAVTLPEQRRQLDELLSRERDAVAITNVAPLSVPGLLQTSDYARAIMIAGHVPPGEIETRVAIRMGRRETLTRSDPAHLLALLDEGVLRRLIGGPRVMAGQLRYLIRAAELPNVDLRVIPADSGWHPGLVGPFVLCRDADGSTVVHLETTASGLFLHQPADVQPYEEAAQRVLEAALDPAESVDRIAVMADRLEGAVVR